MKNRMNRDEYENFRDEVLKKRFYLVYTYKMLQFLQDRGHRYLYKAIHTKEGFPFWIFDRTDSLLESVKEYLEAVASEKSEKESERS